MSLGYLEHSKTRYLRNHYEIYDYRKEKEAEKQSYESARAQREAALEARQQERKEALEALIEANRVYTPSSRLRQEIEEEARQKRVDKERERERKEKLAADRAEAEKFKSKVSSRNSFNSRLVGYREDRTSRLEKQAQFNKIERDRRAKEREARSYARSGIKVDDSDSDEEKPTTRASTRTSRPSASSSRLISRYRDAPTTERPARSERNSREESAPVASSSRANIHKDSPSSSSDEE